MTVWHNNLPHTNRRPEELDFCVSINEPAVVYSHYERFPKNSPASGKENERNDAA